MKPLFAFDVAYVDLLATLSRAERIRYLEHFIAENRQAIIERGIIVSLRLHLDQSARAQELEAVAVRLDAKLATLKIRFPNPTPNVRPVRLR